MPSNQDGQSTGYCIFTSTKGRICSLMYCLKYWISFGWSESQLPFRVEVWDSEEQYLRAVQKVSVCSPWDSQPWAHWHCDLVQS